MHLGSFYQQSLLPPSSPPTRSLRILSFAWIIAAGSPKDTRVIGRETPINDATVKHSMEIGCVPDADADGRAWQVDTDGLGTGMRGEHVGGKRGKLNGELKEYFAS